MGVAPSKHNFHLLVRLRVFNTGPMLFRSKPSFGVGEMSHQEKTNLSYNSLALSKAKLCLSKEPHRGQICVSVLQLRESRILSFSNAALYKEWISGYFSLDTAERGKDDSFGEIFRLKTH
ncbi:hypothetical protein A7K93_00155 [Candidatus Methylacidiphilum fumarolicum]|nr:hypothetical protein A7K73_03590 [Candidatus Methylacidiphilum fumarolicum]TFE74762.1 hypothetical protein A7K72_03125 [Candidatus Methylacidiphilum fumarolicum]TFE76008.1 hypothetical protein A7K93_00155 [Candidatus Methylacidiphilum fumarolicum]TFE76407.1 hypothetical protein A7D33_00780 [Candidatus Methylacidiphilum fumarolicum]